MERRTASFSIFYNRRNSFLERQRTHHRRTFSSTRKSDTAAGCADGCWISSGDGSAAAAFFDSYRRRLFCRNGKNPRPENFVGKYFGSISRARIFDAARCAFCAGGLRRKYEYQYDSRNGDGALRGGG